MSSENLLSVEDHTQLVTGMEWLDPRQKEQLIEAYKTQFNAMYASARKHAVAAILARNFSHTLWEEMWGIAGHQMTPEYVWFLGQFFSGCKNMSEAFENDTQEVSKHEIFHEYGSQRGLWFTPVEALQKIDWVKFFGREPQNHLPSQHDIFMSSRAGNLWSCAGRVNTILSILLIHEWPEYVNNSVEFWDVIEDTFARWMQRIPINKRWQEWLTETLMYEDPHGCLTVEWEQVDPALMYVQQIHNLPSIQPHILSKSIKSPHKVVYDILYLSWLNITLSEEEKRKNKWWYLSLLTTFDKIFWPSPFIMRQHSLITQNTDHIISSGKYYPHMKNTFWYQYALHENSDWDGLENFVQSHYGKQFSVEQILNIYQGK